VKFGEQVNLTNFLNHNTNTATHVGTVSRIGGLQSSSKKQPLTSVVAPDDDLSSSGRDKDNNDSDDEDDDDEKPMGIEEFKARAMGIK
jgi:hypothetical protein